MALIVDDIQRLKHLSVQVKFNWIPREANHTANELAQHMSKIARGDGFWQQLDPIRSTCLLILAQYCNIYSFYWGRVRFLVDKLLWEQVSIFLCYILKVRLLVGKLCGKYFYIFPMIGHIFIITC